MNTKNILVIFRKEALDLLRDRRTLIGMLLVPLLMFPVLTVGFGQFAERMARRARQEVVPLMVLGAEHAPALVERLRQAEEFEILPPAADYAQLISSKKLRVALEIPANFESQLVAEGPAPTVCIYFYETELRSEAASRRVEEFVRAYRDDVVNGRLAVAGLPAAFFKPIQLEEQNAAPEEKVGGLRLATFLPYIIILLCMSGAIHPAIDLTAGEKERGTLETILSCAIGRGDLVMGKFLFVLAASLISAMVSLLSYGLTIRLAQDYLQEMTRGYNYSFSLLTAALVFLLVLPLAVLFSATLLAVSLAAKNYKEAQNYTTPMTIAVLLPAMTALIPGMELNNTLAMVPILNVSLVCRELFTGTFPVVPLLITFGSTCVFAGIALLAAFRMFQTESVLFRS